MPIKIKTFTTIKKVSAYKAFKKIGANMQTTIDMRFRNTVDPQGKKWAKLSIGSTLKPALLGLPTKRKGDKPLNDTGRLKNSFVVKTGRDFAGKNYYAAVGTNVIYAKTHNYGAEQGEYKMITTKFGKKRPIPWGKIPRRQFVGFSVAQKKRYRDLLKKELEYKTVRISYR